MRSRRLSAGPSSLQGIVRSSDLRSVISRRLRRHLVLALASAYLALDLTRITVSVVGDDARFAWLQSLLGAAAVLLFPGAAVYVCWTSQELWFVDAILNTCCAGAIACAFESDVLTISSQVLLHTFGHRMALVLADPPVAAIAIVLISIAAIAASIRAIGLTVLRRRSSKTA